ncbi:MAG TPA: transposase [Candidatus Angelobacter sp.]
MARIQYSRELKISAMRELDAGETSGQVARKFEISPKLLEKWRAEWRARGEAAFPGAGRRPRLEISSSQQQRIAELERKIGQMAMENDFLKKALQHFKEQHPPAVVSGERACTAKSGKPPQAEAQ